MSTLQSFDRGLGQLEAYLDMNEGVAFRMDNGLYWNSLSADSPRAIQGVAEKQVSSKFWVSLLASGKVMLRSRTGKFLAPVQSIQDPRTFPVRLVPRSESPSLQFQVFHSGNRVAFQSHNGLFLERVYSRADTLEATVFFPKESCFFYPLIGDLDPPTFSLHRLIPMPITGMSSKTCLVGKRTYVNKTDETEQHTFKMSWGTQFIDKTFWPHLWGLGIHSLFHFLLGQAKPLLIYTKDNEHRPHVRRYIFETLTKEVTVPPKSKALAFLLVDCYEPNGLPFTAVICKVKPHGASETLREAGSWKGIFYDNLRINVKYKNINGHAQPCKAGEWETLQRKLLVDQKS